MAYDEKKMSRLNKSITPSIIEPEEFEEKSEIAEYIPQHPMLAFKAAQQAAHEAVPDHLENYQEVSPFAAVTK